MAKAKPITDEKKISQQEDRISELKKLLVYYHEITETIREPFIILDNDLTVVTANLAFYEKFKVKKKDTEGKQIYELGDNQWDSLELRELLENILPAHKVLSNYVVNHDFPKIGPRTILLNARQVDAKQLILLAMEDITEAVKLKTDTDEMTANLVKQRDQLEKLSDAKDEFISLASHQLRTPATAVKLYSGMLSQGHAGKLSKKQTLMMNIVNKSNDRQLEIIEDLLRVAKIDSGKVYLEKKLYDMTKLVQRIIKEQKVVSKSREQSLEFKKPDKPVIISIDQKLMRMVLENLIDNAGKYSPIGGKITIDIKQNSEHVSVSIKDNGVGIKKADQKKLFKKFSRIKNSLAASVDGTGLGLYWAKKILDLHDGSIEVDSKLDEGSIFTVKIPVDKDESPETKS